jgi:hypothetical protein
VLTPAQTSVMSRRPGIRCADPRPAGRTGREARILHDSRAWIDLGIRCRSTTSDRVDADQFQRWPSCNIRQDVLLLRASFGVP